MTSSDSAIRPAMRPAALPLYDITPRRATAASAAQQEPVRVLTRSHSMKRGRRVSRPRFQMTQEDVLRTLWLSALGVSAFSAAMLLAAKLSH